MGDISRLLASYTPCLFPQLQMSCPELSGEPFGDQAVFGGRLDRFFLYEEVSVAVLYGR
jgi:hypothetical protein